MAADNSWPVGSPLGFTKEEADALIATVSNLQLVTPDQSRHIAGILLNNWPWLNSSRNDLAVSITMLREAFMAHSTLAAFAALDPISGLAALHEKPPTQNAVVEFLSQYDAKLRGSVSAIARLKEQAAERRDAAERRKEMLERKNGKT